MPSSLRRGAARRRRDTFFHLKAQGQAGWPVLAFDESTRSDTPAAASRRRPERGERRHARHGRVRPTSESPTSFWSKQWTSRTACSVGSGRARSPAGARGRKTSDRGRHVLRHPWHQAGAGRPRRQAGDGAVGEDRATSRVLIPGRLRSEVLRTAATPRGDTLVHACGPITPPPPPSACGGRARADLRRRGEASSTAPPGRPGPWARLRQPFPASTCLSFPRRPRTHSARRPAMPCRATRLRRTVRAEGAACPFEEVS